MASEKWEYKEVPIPLERDTIYHLNKWGAAGWELVSISNYVAYFKKRL